MAKHLKVYEKTILRHLFDGSHLNVYDKTITNLSVGAPGPDLLENCCKIFDKATKHRMDFELKNNSYLFQYGPAIGMYDVRNKLASYLSQEYRDTVLGDSLVLTTGATHGLHLILSTLIDMDGVIIVDEVTYMIALQSIGQFTNMKIRPVKLNENGVDTNELCQILKQSKFTSKNKLFWGAYYTIPTFHNPTGIIFSEDVCKTLIKLAREYDILIICDDVYNILHYTTKSIPKRLFAYDDIDDDDYKGNVISNGSFSKTIAPGCRIGWMECPPRCVGIFNTCGILKSGGCANNYTFGILNSLLELNLVNDHIKMMADKYKSRMCAVCDILEKELPSYCTFKIPHGGYFIWICLPADKNATLFNKFCIDKYKISFIPGDVFSVEKKFTNCFRITIAFHTKEVLADAAKGLCIAIKEFCNS